jgi:Uma2 family endonuclease
MTLEEWAAMDEDEPGELVDGRLVEEEVARNLHEAAVSWTIGTLRTWAKPRGARVFGSEHKLGVSPGQGRKPDVSMYAAGTRLRADAGLSRTPPHVVVEVLSPTPRDVHRDRVDKLKEYARFGVPYYWLLDPRTRLLEILELGADGRYTIALSASSGTVAAPGCEGLTLDLGDLWAEVDELSFDDGDEDADTPSSPS